MRGAAVVGLVTGGLVVVMAALIAVIGPRTWSAWPSASSSSSSSSSSSGASLPNAPRGQLGGGRLGEADGAVTGDVTVFDDGTPAVARLDPDLLGALRRAATAAKDDGVDFHVNSGWRSAAYQNQLLREAVAKYGSKQEAARWVATPETSAHVSGDAVDIGRSDAADWLARHGAAYGLCQTYENEPWHYEMRTDAVTDGCPRKYADAAHDPRTRQ